MSLLIANEVEENVTEGCLYAFQMSFEQESLAKEKMGKCKQLSVSNSKLQCFKRRNRNLLLFSCKYVEIVSGYKPAIYKGDQP